MRAGDVRVRWLHLPNGYHWRPQHTDIQTMFGSYYAAAVLEGLMVAGHVHDSVDNDHRDRCKEHANADGQEG